MFDCFGLMLSEKGKKNALNHKPDLWDITHITPLNLIRQVTQKKWCK